jgi:hypothetical protein
VLTSVEVKNDRDTGHSGKWGSDSTL